MLTFTLNGDPMAYDGDPKRFLLSWLREERGLTAAKDGCSGQGACGACLVEVDGRAVLSCSTPMDTLQGAEVVTIEGFPQGLRRTLGTAFAAQGAVRCGFCTPGFLTRAKIFLRSNPNPTRDEAASALRDHLCRCTGYVKIVDAVLEAAAMLREGRETSWGQGDVRGAAGEGGGTARLHALDHAVGSRPFVDDLRFDGMVHGALVFSQHPRAEVVSIDVTPALASPGVIRTFTAGDIPGRRNSGMLVQDWPLMIGQGETTRYVGDVVAGVVAETEAQAREAVGRFRVGYQPHKPLTEMIGAAQSSIKVHIQGNVLARRTVRRGDPVDEVLEGSAHVASGVFSTQMVEHGFLETECAVALPEEGGIRVYSQGQDIAREREQIAAMLGLPLEKVRVSQVDAGGAFGGKLDLSVQGHAAMFAFKLGRPVKVKFSRPESLRFHPKRHPMRLEYALGCDTGGRLTALRARILADTGAYASLGGPVIERAASHAGGAYHVPHVDIEATAVFTNNIPGGAMCGSGVNQVTFAMESLVEELCAKGGFDPWQFRHDNVLEEGPPVPAMATGVGPGVGGLRAALLAVKEPYRAARHAGLALATCEGGQGECVENTSPGGAAPACGFAAHLAILGDDGRVTRLVAAQESGRAVNPVEFEGLVQGGVAMGLGCALTERFRLEKGRLMSEKLSDCGMLRAEDMPAIEVIAVDSGGPGDPCEATCVGEISAIPTAAAVANAFFHFDGTPRRDLPLKAPKGGGR